MKRFIHTSLNVLAAIVICAVLPSCTDEILQLSVSSVTIDSHQDEIFVGSTLKLNATVKPSNAKNKTVEWISSDASVATVQDGVVTGIKPGKAVITAKCEDKSAICNITVKPVAVESIALDKNSIILGVGESETLVASISPAIAEDKTVIWTSSDEAIATVSESGEVRAVSYGNCTISAFSSNGKEAICSVFVKVDVVDLSAGSTANCYVVSKAGIYKFNATVKGSSTIPLDGTPVKTEVLWESFGTNVKPKVGDIIKDVSLGEGYVSFYTPSTLKNGNAVIAVKDDSDNILWSWHIWVCDGFDPLETAQTYYNNAGTMMDRNLGATSATPGDVRALGLMYQWGRKDPFLGSSSISKQSYVQSSIIWPSEVLSNEQNRTIEYAVAHPTTFVARNLEDRIWPVSGSSDYTCWQSSEKEKGVYDPCPPGWRVPDGGNNSVWAKAFGTSSRFEDGPWDDTNYGMDFGSGNGQASNHQLGEATIIWYPATGYLCPDSGFPQKPGVTASYWACNSSSRGCHDLDIRNTRTVHPSYKGECAHGWPVRCAADKGIN